jgi:N6-adenosine-specific RNA methylase IME4
MTLKDIERLPVADLAHPDGARLFLWITAPLMIRSGEFLKAWGFRYSTCIPWIKTWPRDGGVFLYADSMARGQGLEAVGNAEFLVIGKRGRPQSIKGNPFPSPLIEARREHSRKPKSYRQHIIDRLDGPRCEVFGREPIAGFEVFGDEADKFAGAA